MKTVRDVAKEEIDELKRRLDERGGPLNGAELAQLNAKPNPMIMDKDLFHRLYLEIVIARLSARQRGE